MIASAPKVVALAYYDGVTEGFLHGFNDDQVYYFKVVAWDQNQDNRLFMLGQVDRAIYLELLNMLAASQQPPTDSPWIPTWTFEGAEIEARANEIVEIGKRSLSTPAFLAVGRDLLGTVSVVRPTPKAVETAVALAGKDTPGNLADWLAQST